MGKMLALSEAINLKWKEIWLQIVKVVDSFSRMMVPDWVMKAVPAVGGFFKQMKGYQKDLQADLIKSGERVRALEKAAGLGGLTETTRALKRKEEGFGMSKEERDSLFKRFGGQKLKIEQNIAKVEIHQDFKDQDPDRVMVEFISDMERLGETALQSTAGGEADVFGPGSSF
jgi:hypothetical protein